MTTDIISTIVFFGGLVLPLCGWIWIALLEKNYPQDSGYITMLGDQLKMYLDNPALGRETEDEMLHSLVKQAKEKNM